MSWATCYSGSNNIHFNFPPIMNDGRNYSSYIPGSAMDKEIKERQNIKTNSDYRAYLQINADQIIKNNQLNSCNECSSCHYINNQNQNLNLIQPYIFNSILSNDQPFGYEGSDLKNLYLSRQKMEAQLYAPRFNIK
tara:strand:- start:5201 stop:5608 length:408 start_codon:yes stop_codon:yes gene_type:complete